MTTSYRVLFTALTSLFLISTVAAQTLSDVILSLSDRQRVVSQGKQVSVYLLNENNLPTETDQPIPDDNPIDWLGVGKNPTQSAVDGLELGGKIALLNQAVAVFDQIKFAFINSSLSEFQAGGTVGSLRGYTSADFGLLPKATPANYQELLQLLSQRVRSLRLIHWGSAFRTKSTTAKTDIHERVVYDDPQDTNQDNNRLPRIEIHDADGNVVESTTWKPSLIGPNNSDLQISNETSVGPNGDTRIYVTGRYGEDQGDEDFPILRSQCIQLNSSYAESVTVCTTAPAAAGSQIAGTVYILRRNSWHELDISEVSSFFDKNSAGFVVEGSSDGGSISLIHEAPRATFRGSWLTTASGPSGWDHNLLEESFVEKGYAHKDDIDTVWHSRIIGFSGYSSEPYWEVSCKFNSVFVPAFTRGVDADTTLIKLEHAARIYSENNADGALNLHPRPSLSFGIDLGPGLKGGESSYISTRTLSGSWFGNYTGYDAAIGYSGNADGVWDLSYSIPRFDSSYLLQLAGSCADFHVVYENDRSKRTQKLPADTSTSGNYDFGNLYYGWERPRLKQVVGRDLVADITYNADHFGGYTVKVYRRPTGSVVPTPGKVMELAGMRMIRTWIFSHLGGSNPFPTDLEKLEVMGSGGEKFEIQANQPLPNPSSYGSGWPFIRTCWWWVLPGTWSWTVGLSQGGSDKIKKEISIVNASAGSQSERVVTIRDSLDGQLVKTVISKTLDPFGDNFPQDWVITTAGKTITGSATFGDPTDRATRYGRLPTSVSIKYGGIQPDEDYIWDSKGLLSSFVGGSWSTTGAMDGGAFKQTHMLNGSPVSTDWVEFLDGGKKIKTYSAPDGAVGSKSDSSVAWSEVEYGTATNGLPGLPLMVKNSDGSGITYDWNANQSGSYILTLKEGKASGNAVTGGIKLLRDINERGQPNKIEVFAANGGELKTGGTVFSDATAWGMPKTGMDFSTGRPSTWSYADDLSRISSYTDSLGVASGFSGYDVIGRPATISNNGISATMTYNVFSQSATLSGAGSGSSSETRDNLGRLIASSLTWNGVSGSSSFAHASDSVGISQTNSLLGTFQTTLRQHEGTVTSASGPTLPFGGTEGSSLTVEGGLLKSTVKLGNQSATYQTTWADAWGRIRKSTAPIASGTGTTEYLYSNASSSLKRVCITDPTGRKTITESDPYATAGAVTRSGIDVNGNGSLGASDRYVESTTSVSGGKLVTTLKLTEDSGLREILRTEWNPNGNQAVTSINGSEETITRTPNYTAKTVTTISSKGWTKNETFNNLGLTTNSALSGAGVPAASLTSAWRADGSLSGVTFTTGGNTHSATCNNNGTLASLIAPGQGNILSNHSISGGSETLTVDGVTTVTKLDGTQTSTSGSDLIGKTDTLAINGAGFKETTHPVLGADTTVDLHASGAPKAKNYAAGNGENYSYASGLFSRISLARGGDLSLGYTNDGAKDLTSATWPSLASGVFTVPTATQSFGYDRAGRVNLIGDSSGVRAIAYQNGRSRESAWNSGPLAGYKVATSLDASGRDMGFTLYRGNTVIHSAVKAPNGVSAEISGISSGPFNATYGRDTARNLTFITRGSVAQNWTRTGGRITAASSSVSGTPTFTYTSFDAKGRRLTSATSGGTWTYQYTNGQLTSAVHPTLGSFTYQFDGIGRRIDKGSANTSDLLNRTLAWNNNQSKMLKVTAAPAASVWVGFGTAASTQIPNFTGNYSYPVPSPGALGGWVAWNALAVLAGQGDAGANPDAKAEQSGAVWIPPVSESFSYDAAGNRQSTASWDLGWDGKNQLVRARTKNYDSAPQSYDITNGYDAEGRRFCKKVKRWQNGKIIEQKNITFLHDGNDLIYESYPLPGGLTLLERRYVWGPDISGTQGGAGGAGGLLLIRETKGTVTTDLYPLYDGSGNVIALSDDTGALQAEYAYGPFGETIYARGPKAASCPFRYATKYYDQETGLYNFGKRFLDPLTGQWLSRELLGESESLNLYSYCHNDPVNKVDVLGLKEQVIAGSDPVFFQDPENSLSVLMGFPLEEDGWFSPFAPNSKYGLVQMSMTKRAAEQYLAHPEMIGNLRGAAGVCLEADRLQRIARNGEVAIFYTGNTLQVAGGYAEAAGGVALAPETGGVSLLAVAHGADVSATAIRRLAAGPGIDVQSATSTGLQMIGLSRSNAETGDTVASLLGAGGAMYAVSKGPLIFAPRMTNAGTGERLNDLGVKSYLRLTQGSRWGSHYDSFLPGTARLRFSLSGRGGLWRGAGSEGSATFGQYASLQRPWTPFHSKIGNALKGVTDNAASRLWSVSARPGFYVEGIVSPQGVFPGGYTQIFKANGNLLTRPLMGSRTPWSVIEETGY